MPAAPRKSKSAKRAAPRQRAAPKRAKALTKALAEAAWIEADAALAQALADLDEAQTAPDEAAREGALAVLAQSLARAARKRGMTRIATLGAREPYDPARHDLIAAFAKTPKSVRIAARGVSRAGTVLEKPRAGPVRRKQRP